MRRGSPWQCIMLCDHTCACSLNHRAALPAGLAAVGDPLPRARSAHVPLSSSAAAAPSSSAAAQAEGPAYDLKTAETKAKAWLEAGKRLVERHPFLQMSGAVQMPDGRYLADSR